MGERGPIPKRSEELVRRNKPDVPVDKVDAIGTVQVPDLDIENPHQMITDFYDSLRDSAQSRFYEPSDWVYARFTMHFANQLLYSSRPSSQLLAAVNQMLSNLLVSEGDRRRVRLEVERKTAGGEGAKVVQMSDVLRERLRG